MTHYGSDISGWLDSVPGRMNSAAERWKLTLGAYHDTGHASVVATAEDFDGRPLILKAWVDPARFRSEVTALRVWAGGPAAGVVEVADDLAVAALEMIGGRPGGCRRPAWELPSVAAALRAVHTAGRRQVGSVELPSLTSYLRQEVRPRVRRRLELVEAGEWLRLVDAALPDLAALEEDGDRTTVLHADLYRENVLFNQLGHPCLADPLPMVGDAAFDWAFWTVYYDLGRGTSARLATAARISRIPALALVPWCRALALDGLLFYLETDDPRAAAMADVLTWLAETTYSRSQSR
ncbi:aminoglycoside phosphotransferase family protein [Streptomyces sp. NPDC002640]